MICLVYLRLLSHWKKTEFILRILYIYIHITFLILIDRRHAEKLGKCSVSLFPHLKGCLFVDIMYSS